MLDNDGDGDSDSLFGSPSTSPVRGRSPALALPGTNGGDGTKNVGTIALPGSHAYIELPYNTPALSLSGSSLYEPTQRSPAIQTPRSQFEFQARPSPSPSDSTSFGRSEKKKKKSSRESSSAPRAPPPPIHLPDPNAPPPPNFLRNQQALLGTAGLVGGVHPAKLSVERHTRGSTPLNPIVVEDGPARPLNRTPQPQSVLDISKSVPPSNEEIIASLIREKNVYPVLESILKLITAKKPSKSQNDGDGRTGTGEPAPKRRRTNSEVEDAEQESSDLEKERGKELIAQLVFLIKNAARQSVVRTYQPQNLPQHPQPRRAHPPQRWSSRPQAFEPKIMGHYRPITATYGRSGSVASEVLADQSNTTHNGSHTSIGTNLNKSTAPQIPSPLSNSHYQQPSSPLQHQPDPTSAQTFNQFLSSFLAVPEPNNNPTGWDTDQSSSSSGLDFPEVNQHVMDTWMSLFGSLPSEGSLTETASQPASEFDMDLLVSPPSEFPLHGEFSDFLPESSNDVTECISTSKTDFVIDPFLLNLPPSSFTTSLHPSYTGALQPQPSLAANSTESSARGFLAPQTPIPEPAQDLELQGMWDQNLENLLGLFMQLPEDPLAGAQGMWNQNVANVFGSFMQPPEDPLAAANALLQFSAPSTSKTSTTTQPPAHVPCLTPAIHQDTPRPTYQIFPQNGLNSIEQPLSSVSRPPLASQRSFMLRPMPTADKQSILARAKERRRQLIGEIDRAKVELWETTIEQGVLAQLVKEKL